MSWQLAVRLLLSQLRDNGQRLLVPVLACLSERVHTHTHERGEAHRAETLRHTIGLCSRATGDRSVPQTTRAGTRGGGGAGGAGGTGNIGKFMEEGGQRRSS